VARAARGARLLARRTRGRAFAALGAAERQALVEGALRGVAGDRLPAPLAAGHVALALLSHWASSPAAWDLAYGARITPASCRPLADARDGRSRSRRHPEPDRITR
jgi:hypothetical protein